MKTIKGYIAIVADSHGFKCDGIYNDIINLKAIHPRAYKIIEVELGDLQPVLEMERIIE